MLDSSSGRTLGKMENSKFVDVNHFFITELKSINRNDFDQQF